MHKTTNRHHTRGWWSNQSASHQHDLEREPVKQIVATSRVQPIQVAIFHIHRIMHTSPMRAPIQALMSKVSCRESCEKTLKDLGCKHLDLMLMHWPDAWEPGSGDPGKADESVTTQQTWWGAFVLTQDTGIMAPIDHLSYVYSFTGGHAKASYHCLSAWLVYTYQ